MTIDAFSDMMKMWVSEGLHFKGFATLEFILRGWKVMSDILNNIILILIIVNKTIIIIEKIKKPSADNTRQK